MDGAFEDSNENSTANFLYVYVQLLFHNQAYVDDNSTDPDAVAYSMTISDVHRMSLVEDTREIDRMAELRRTHVFNISQKSFDQIHKENVTVRIRMWTNIEDSLPVQIAYDPSPIDKITGVIYASIVLLGLYIMIIWEIVHRTFAAMIASTLSIAILAYMNERPTMPELMSWIDVETLLLLFGMMILVAILSETGIFDYLAVYAYKVIFPNTNYIQRLEKNIRIIFSFCFYCRLQMEECGL